MPVDERLEAGFRRNADALRADPEAALTDVLAAGRRRARRRKALRIGVAVVAASLLIAFGPELGRAFLTQPGVTPGTDRTPAASIADPLVGVWRSTHTCGDERAAVAAAGLTSDAERLSVHCHAGQVGLATFSEGWLELRGKKGALGWSGPYEVTSESTFVAGHESFDGRLYLEYRFAIHGTSLEVELVRDDYPNPGRGRNGRIGDLIAQTIAWNSTPFERVS